MSRVDPKRLRLAREAAGLQKKELAERIGVSPASITQYEAGRTTPPQRTRASIALACGLPREFLSAPSPAGPLSTSPPFFRSLRSTRQWERDEAEARATFVWQVTNAIEDRVNLPALSLPDLHLHEGDPIGEASARAAELRRLWGLPPGPVGNVAQLIEARGAVCARISGRSTRVDAFSQWMDGRPLVILWRTKGDTARSRFDAAHELGHLVLHPDPEPGNKLMEDQAHAFAAEFLMPAAEIYDHLPSRPPRRGDMEDLIAVKEHWGVALAALFYRSRELGRLNRETHRRAMIRLSEFGYRVREPGDLGPPETPALLRKALELTENAGGWGFEELVSEVCLPRPMLEEICGLTEENAPPAGAIRPATPDPGKPAQLKPVLT